MQGRKFSLVCAFLRTNFFSFSVLWGEIHLVEPYDSETWKSSVNFWEHTKCLCDVLLFILYAEIVHQFIAYSESEFECDSFLTILDQIKL